MKVELLVTAAEVLKKSCREEDVIARYGGDEFVVILYGAGEEVLGKIVERIEKNSKKVSIEGFPLSISLGYACKLDSSQSIDDVMKQADRKMYENKR